MASRYYVTTEALKPATGYSVGDYIFVQETAKLYQADGSLVWSAPTSSVELPVGNSTVPNQYRTLILTSGSHIAGKIAGTYAMGFGDPLAISGTGTLYPIAAVHITAAEYPAVTTIATKLRLKAQLFTNDVPPTGNFTFGLYPITRPATSGGAGLCIYTLGTVVTGSTVLFTTPVADASLQGSSGDFSLPPDGFYCIGVVTTSTIAVSAHTHMTAQLHVRNN